MKKHRLQNLISNIWFSRQTRNRVMSGKLNHNFELLLTQIFCRRLNLGQGIVRLRVGLPYDRLRFIPRSYDLSHLLCLENSAGVERTLPFPRIYFHFFSCSFLPMKGKLCWGNFLVKKSLKAKVHGFLVGYP